MKPEGSAELTFVNVILKFGYDQIIFLTEMYYWKTCQIPASSAAIQNIAKLKDLVFTLISAISS